MSRSGRAAAAVLALTAVAVTACSNTPDTSDAASGSIFVDSSSDACTLSTASAPSGSLVFEVTNTGNAITEFYLLGDDGLRIIGEVENIGPGITRDLVVQAEPGRYQTACKPGMVGDGIRAPFEITDSGDEAVDDGGSEAQLERATDAYAAYVKDQSAQLVTDTEAFAAAYVAGDDDRARARYAPTRMHWERIEPVAESFGDLDPRLDLREADLEPGQEWTGWHAIEKDLWPPNNHQPLTSQQRKRLAALLVADTLDLHDRVQRLTYTPAQLGNGAKELLDEVATGKVTGEEEFWSHTDLWDFQANVDGARIAYEELRPVVRTKDPELARTLDDEFVQLQTLLNRYRLGDEEFVFYDDLSPQQVQELADAVDALGEPLSRLTTVVVL